jgi:hypothetical protein
MQYLTRAVAVAIALGAVAVCLVGTASAAPALGSKTLNPLRTEVALGPAAAAAGTYTDVTGDGKGAPDIQNVTVTTGVGGQILFGINVDSLDQGSDIGMFLVLNTDMDATTGAPDSLGADYFFSEDPATRTYGFWRWNGSDWEDTPYSTVQVYSTPTGVKISVNRSELGNTDEFNFWARTRNGDVASEQYDDAPDVGSWNFSLQAGGPDIQGFSVTTKPAAGPKAGKRFSVVPIALTLPLNGDPFQLGADPEGYSCTATLAGRPLTGSGTSGCTWKVPKKSRGKKLAVVVTVTYQGIAKSLPFSYRVS